MEAGQNGQSQQSDISEKISKKKQILISVFSVIFAAILVNGIQCGMTWKLYLLLAWFPGILIVPWKIKKYFLIGLAVLILAVICWILIPENSDGEWKVYTLSRKLGIDVAGAGRLSEIEPVQLQTILHETDWEDFYQKIKSADPDRYCFYHSWTPEKYPELSDLLNVYETEIRGLTDISNYPSYHFDIQPGIESTNQVSREIYYLMMSARLLCSSANQNAGSGRIEEAIEQYRALLEIGQKMYEQDYSNFSAMGLAIQGCGYGGLRGVLMEQDVDEEFVQQLEAMLNNEPDYSIKEKQAIYLKEQKNIALDIYARQYVVNDNGEFRFNISSIWNSYITEQMNSDRNAYRKGLKSRIGVIVGWLINVPQSEDILNKVESTYESYIQLILSDGDNILTEKQKIPSSFIFFNYYRYLNASILEQIDYENFFVDNIRKIFLKKQSQKAGIRLLCLLWRYHHLYGNFPDSLENIIPGKQMDYCVDPSNGEQFVYALTEKGFKLYSKGVNGIDEAGDRNDPAMPVKGDSLTSLKKKLASPAHDDIMIWPRREQEKNNIDPGFLLQNAYE